jgi:acyl carrier protein
MTISTRTPEGHPLRCDVCGAMVVVETSLDSGDATCPACGHLLWRVRNRLATELNLSEDDITLTRQLQGELVADSVDFVELVMTIEDEFDLAIPDAEYERLRTVSDVVSYLRRLRNLSEEGPRL